MEIFNSFYSIIIVFSFLFLIVMVVRWLGAWMLRINEVIDNQQKTLQALRDTQHDIVKHSSIMHNMFNEFLKKQGIEVRKDGKANLIALFIFSATFSIANAQVERPGQDPSTPKPFISLYSPLYSEHDAKPLPDTIWPPQITTDATAAKSAIGDTVPPVHPMTTPGNSQDMIRFNMSAPSPANCTDREFYTRLVELYIECFDLDFMHKDSCQQEYIPIGSRAKYYTVFQNNRKTKGHYLTKAYPDPRLTTGNQMRPYVITDAEIKLNWMPNTVVDSLYLCKKR